MAKVLPGILPGINIPGITEVMPFWQFSENPYPEVHGTLAHNILQCMARQAIYHAGWEGLDPHGLNWLARGGY